jgi:hypothetical protein
MQGLPSSAPDGQSGVTQIMRIPAPLLCYWMGATEAATDETDRGAPA